MYFMISSDTLLSLQFCVFSWPGIIQVVANLGDVLSPMIYLRVDLLLSHISSYMPL